MMVSAGSPQSKGWPSFMVDESNSPRMSLNRENKYKLLLLVSNKLDLVCFFYHKNAIIGLDSWRENCELKV